MSVSLPRLGLVTPTRHVLVHSNELTLLRIRMLLYNLNSMGTLIGTLL